MNILKCISIWWSRSMLCWLSTKFTANPLLPNRPVRPIRWRYVSLSAFPSRSTGRSKLTTIDTCSTSIPAITNSRGTFHLTLYTCQYKYIKSTCFFIFILICLTSRAHICRHKHLLLAIPKPLNDCSSLLHSQFSTQQRHLVPLLGQLYSQPSSHFAGLNKFRSSHYTSS